MLFSQEAFNMLIGFNIFNIFAYLETWKCSLFLIIPELPQNTE